MRLTRRYIALTLLLSLACLAPACPQQADLDRLANATNDLAHSVELATDLTIDLYKANVLPLKTKDKILDKLKLVATNGKKFNQILIELDVKYKNQELPPDALSFVRENFRLISAPFYEIWGELNLFGKGDVVKDLQKNVKTIEGVIGQ